MLLSGLIESARHGDFSEDENFKVRCESQYLISFSNIVYFIRTTSVTMAIGKFENRKHLFSHRHVKCGHDTALINAFLRPFIQFNRKVLIPSQNYSVTKAQSVCESRLHIPLTTPNVVELN
jgi:hypothetical protein